VVVYDRLKAERVEQPLEADEIRQRVQTLPEWTLLGDAKALTREMDFPGEAEAQAYSNYLFTLKDGLQVRMRVTIEGSRLKVHIGGPSASKRLTESALKLAAALTVV
jgi:pterin-4a-carbinolamine dehydratase